MAEKSLKVGLRVFISERGPGTIAYIGTTQFSQGKWIGVILDEPKGKNNGTVQGKEYFKCRENHGAFVRQTQLLLLDESGNPIPGEPFSSDSSSLDDKNRSRLSNIRKKSKPASAVSPRAIPEPKVERLSSRLSLIGSRSPSDLGTRENTPSKDATTTIHASENVSSKRASFVEQGKTRISPKQGTGIPCLAPSKSSASTPKRPPSTQSSREPDQTGFVETLKPQFTPGQVLASPGIGSSMIGAAGDGGERMNISALHQENEFLKGKLKDATEKLETLRAKRLQDKEQMRDFEKMKLQLESAMEFKNRIMESQANLQRDLQRARAEAREAIEAKEAHAEEMSELAESMEMATLDKEMAEEKAETLQVELDQARDKIEELTVDLELLKAQMSENESGQGDAQVSTTNTFQVKQLEQQNARLHETIVRFRDIAAHEKHEFQKLQKELDQRKSENTELSRTKEKLSARVEELESQIADLQEQVDAALGAEEMVEQLADKKLTLEERVAALQEEVLELEQLQDMNEQLAEGSRELEVELREEADLARAATREAQREKEAALETLADREITIGKFRELVQKLQDQCQDLQTQLERETARPVSKMPEVLDFKKMFAESKAHTRAIDLELRRIEVQESNQHVQYLTAFMPDTFMCRGGDHDAVLVLLLVPRLIWKTQVLLSQIKDKYPAPEAIDRLCLLRSHVVEQYAFRCRLSNLLFSVQCILHQYMFALNSCSPETLLKIGNAYPDMAVQEKAIDHYLELLRKDQLDENVTVDGLERFITYFSTMYPILVAGEVNMNQSQLAADIVRTLTSAMDCIRTDASAVLALTKLGEEGGNIAALATHLTLVVDAVSNQLKTARRFIPQGQLEGALSNMGFDSKLTTTLMDCCISQSQRITRLLRDVVRSAVAHISSTGDADNGIPQAKLLEFLTSASAKYLEQDSGGQNPVDSIRSTLDLITQQVATLLQALQANDYDASIPIKAEEKPMPPVQKRAAAVRSELDATKHLTNKLETKEAEIKELRAAIKLKQEELSELQLRKDMAERKLENATKDSNVTIEKLQRKVTETENLLKEKEKEYEVTMDHLQTDIDSLETERTELKDRLKGYTKKTTDGLPKPTVVSSASPASPISARNDSLGQDSFLYVNEIKNLRLALRNKCNENNKLRGQLCGNMMSSLKPLNVPKFGIGDNDKYNENLKKLDALDKKARGLLKDVQTAWTLPKLVDITQRKKGSADYLIEEYTRISQLQHKTQLLQSEVMAELLHMKEGCKAESDFGVFPSREMSNALKEKDSLVIGRITLPIQEKVPGKYVPVDLDSESLSVLQKKLIVFAS